MIMKWNKALSQASLLTSLRVFTHYNVKINRYTLASDWLLFCVFSISTIHHPLETDIISIISIKLQRQHKCIDSNQSESNNSLLRQINLNIYLFNMIFEIIEYRSNSNDNITHNKSVWNEIHQNFAFVLHL